jgi:hypothetical protein
MFGLQSGIGVGSIALVPLIFSRTEQIAMKKIRTLKFSVLICTYLGTPCSEIKLSCMLRWNIFCSWLLILLDSTCISRDLF